MPRAGHDASTIGPRLNIMREKDVSGACRRVLQSLGGYWWSLESGYQLQTDAKTGKVIPRKGGTRTTPGFPDLIAHVPLLRSEHWFSMTVECKGKLTHVSPAQWLYAQLAASHGLLHFMVRSSDELLTGLSYCGLLDPNRQNLHDATQWPQNLNYLPQAAERFWAVYEHPIDPLLRWRPGPLPENDRPRP